MEITFIFILNSILLGVGLAMDAFSVSVANAINDAGMKKRKMILIAGMFAFFQIIMPLIGWIAIRTIADIFNAFEKAIPWIALFLLGFIGIKMIIDTVKGSDDEEKPPVGFGGLIVQGIATSIDALSVGFTIAEYKAGMAVLSAVIIGIVTFIICMGGLLLGRTIGSKLKNKAGIVGGVILILIGLEIFITNVFF